LTGVEVFKFPTPDSLAEKVALDWLQVMTEGPRSTVALSGGRIAGTLFKAAAAMPALRSKLGAAEFFWADERCVPPQHPESNFAVAQKLLLGPLGINRIHRIRGELRPAEAARLAAEELCRVLQNSTLPAIDLLFLGMGEDGHVASLFPGESSEAMKSSAIYRPVTGPKPPPNRVTLGYAAITAAKRVWVLISGAGKEGALQRSLTDPRATPLGRVLRTRGDTRVYTDLEIVPVEVRG
jgi:6-phosphogluconolactonase